MGSKVYVLSGRTGSLMYMAPEVYLGNPYNEKVQFNSKIQNSNSISMRRCVRAPYVGFPPGRISSDVRNCLYSAGIRHTTFTHASSIDST